KAVLIDHASGGVSTNPSPNVRPPRPSIAVCSAKEGLDGSRGHRARGLRRDTGGVRFADAFHVFAIDLTPGRIVFSVDGTMYHTVTRNSLPSGAAWVFDAPFFLLLDVAVGGTFPGSPDATPVFPQEMLVDYVRYTPASS